MIIITQLVYLHKGEEDIFDEFERLAIPIIQQYKGRLLFRVRPTEDQYIERHIEQPYEIHLVEFETDEDFRQFMLDENRKKFLHLKEQSIRLSVLVQGFKL